MFWKGIARRRHPLDHPHTSCIAYMIRGTDPSVTVLNAIITEKTTIQQFTGIQIHPLPTHASRVECNLPVPNTHIRTSTSQPPRPPSSSQSTVLIPPIPAFLILMFLSTSLTLQMYRASRKHSAGCRRFKEGVDSGGTMGPMVCDGLRD